MSILHGLICAFACFSTIPMPHIAWNEKSMRYLLAALPLVGAVVGLGYLLWSHVADALAFGPLMRGVGFALVPLLITGGIHMDGFADVVDAQSSHASSERKRAIMKDPHMGAFASMAIAAYLIAVVGLSSELSASNALAFCCVPVISRCLGAYAVVLWQPSSSKGMLATMQAAANKPVVCALVSVQLAAASLALLICSIPAGIAALIAALGSLAWVHHFLTRDFGGMSGDLVGFYLQFSEILMLACIVCVGKVM